VLVFGLESMHLSKSDIESLDFTFNRLLIKLFKTTNISIINDCWLCFGTKPHSEMLLILSVARNSSSRIIACTILFAKCTLNTVDWYVSLVYIFLFHLQYIVALLHFGVNKVVFTMAAKTCVLKFLKVLFMF